MSNEAKPFTAEEARSKAKFCETMANSRRDMASIAKGPNRDMQLRAAAKYDREAASWSAYVDMLTVATISEKRRQALGKICRWLQQRESADAEELSALYALAQPWANRITDEELPKALPTEPDTIPAQTE